MLGLLLVRLHVQRSQTDVKEVGEQLTHHVVHLVGDVLEPALYALSAGDHSCELGTNDSQGVEGLAERFTLGRPPFKTLVSSPLLR